ncbi:DUF1315 family protein [Marinobacter sp.]|uniref:YeaC family protein n=1 Tax=Marinobacter sp. TaxID=50741 RepID=UPI0019A8FB08|nr:DUF1315 family protein [Marinobacter sp.]MBD3656754.1 DUF1315 family protein [Marinobacter sp.]
MTYEELIQRLDPAVYQSLRQAVALGKWPDGRQVTEEQRAICMEAVIYYENLHQIPEEERVGYIGRRKSCGSDEDKGSAGPVVQTWG